MTYRHPLSVVPPLTEEQEERAARSELDSLRARIAGALEDRGRSRKVRFGRVQITVRVFPKDSPQRVKYDRRR